ncbi:MAG: hypothetical protein ETSY1_19740 [Candidatus Entotheonella factor]|uniref:Uncharacterized protein n=1 Tax=Entotheonella factor TaxID=1429438 RepID=W4LKG5_ENTF1|nr:MAG: hypothetical protein ETSY1_19740 [Candidatus Entotheonella factor]
MPHLHVARLTRFVHNPHASTGLWTVWLVALLCLVLTALNACRSQSEFSKAARYTSAPEAQKITVNLLRLDHQVRTRGTPLPTAAAAIGIGTIGNGVPLEIFTTKINSAVVKKLHLPGVRVRHVSKPYQRVSVVIEDLALLFPLARIREVRMISPAYGATTHITAQGGLNIEPLGGDSHAS